MYIQLYFCIYVLYEYCTKSSEIFVYYKIVMCHIYIQILDIDEDICLRFTSIKQHIKMAGKMCLSPFFILVRDKIIIIHRRPTTIKICIPKIQNTQHIHYIHYADPLKKLLLFTPRVIISGYIPVFICYHSLIMYYAKVILICEMRN